MSLRAHFATLAFVAVQVRNLLAKTEGLLRREEHPPRNDMYILRIAVQSVKKIYNKREYFLFQQP